jgi:hypothetical protein
MVLGALLMACSGEAAASFDPTGPCTTDGEAPGAYPELEARIPAVYEGRAPDLLDSGRNCTSSNLGSLAARGIEEIRYAGGTWDFGSDIAAALVVFSADGLTAEAMAEWFRTTAEAAGRTEITGTSRPEVGDEQAYRLDTKTGERIQTIVVWPAAETDLVNVALTHNLPDPKIDAAIAAFGRE